MVFKRKGLREIPNQGSEGSCTAFALCNIINWFKEPKYKEHWLERDAIKGHDYFSLVNSTYPLELQGALAPIQALVYAQNNGYISMYEQLFIEKLTTRKITKLLEGWFLFLIVVNKCNWDKTENDKIMVRQVGGKRLSHSVVIVDYDDEKQQYKLVNSRWDKRGEDGYFYMKYDDLKFFVTQMFAVYDSDDTGNFERLLYKTKILTAVNILSEQRKRGTEEEKKAMNFAATILRKVIGGQDHQYNMSKKELVSFINKNF